MTGSAGHGLAGLVHEVEGGGSGDPYFEAMTRIDEAFEQEARIFNMLRFIEEESRDLGKSLPNVRSHEAG